MRFMCYRRHYNKHFTTANNSTSLHKYTVKFRCYSRKLAIKTNIFSSID